MSDPVIDLADRVSAKLAECGLSAERCYVPQFDAADFESLQARVRPLTVGPSAEETETTTREAVSAEFRIEVGIAKLADPGLADTLDTAQLDALVAKVGEVKAWLFKHRKLGQFGLLRIVNDPVYDQRSLVEQRTFVSLLVLTYRGFAC